MIRILGLNILAALALAACSSRGTQQDSIALAGQALVSLFNRTEPQQITATRASLTAGGFDEPLLVATLRQPVAFRSGLLLNTTRDGIEIWRGLDGSTVRLDQGIVRATVGAGFDLYSAETDDTKFALIENLRDPYPRTFRHLNGLNQIDVVRFFCEMSEPQRETITVFDRNHQVLRFVETCSTQSPVPSGGLLTIENTFWKDSRRAILWRSDQWISPQIGNILFERVFE